MKKFPAKRQDQLFTTGSESSQNWILRTSIVLIVALFTYNASAQFINVNIKIPTKIGLSEMEALKLNHQPSFGSEWQKFEGTYEMAIPSIENLQVLATLTHTDSLRNEFGSSINFSAKLAYRNDGISTPPKTYSGNSALFNISNCGLLIDNIKGSPPMLNAYVFIHVETGNPVISRSIYRGDINLAVEYN